MFGLTNSSSAAACTPFDYTAPVFATRHFRKTRPGSQASLIECDDGHLYILKMAGNPLEPNRLANEVLGTSLCDAVGLPVPFMKSIFVTQSFLDQSPKLAFGEGAMSYPPMPGLHLGSRFLGDRHDTSRLFQLLAPSHTLRVTNRDRFLGMYLLDVAVNTQGSRQALFVRKGEVFNLQVFFVDHGQMFGGSAWGRCTNMSLPLHHNRDMYLGLWEDAEVALWVATLRRRMPAILCNTIAHVPRAWFIGDTKQLTEYLLARLDQLPELVHESHISFSSGLRSSLTGSVRNAFQATLPVERGTPSHSVSQGSPATRL